MKAQVLNGEGCGVMDSDEQEMHGQLNLGLVC